MSEKDQSSRFTRMNQVFSSYHDYVCYLALEQETGLQVFWYEFINDNLTEEEQQSAFQQLSKAKQINSPHLLNILAVWMTSVPPRFVVITEATQSPSLADYLRTIDTPPLFRTIVKWFKFLAQAVQALHKSPLRITHGEISLHSAYIKPSTGTLKLRLPLTNLSSRIISSSSLDIDAYKSPDRLRGNIEQSNDIWSLGIAFLQLITGKMPYEEMKTPQDLINAISQSILPQSLNSVQNPQAVDLIKKCLAPQMFRINIDQLLAHPVFQEQSAPTQNPLGNADIQILFENDTPNRSQTDLGQSNTDHILDIT